MPVYLVTSSQRVIYQDFIEAPNEDLARVEAMKMRRKLKEVSFQGYGVDDVEEWNDELKDVDVLKATSGGQSHGYYDETGIWQLEEWSNLN